MDTPSTELTLIVLRDSVDAAASALVESRLRAIGRIVSTLDRGFLAALDRRLYEVIRQWPQVAHVGGVQPPPTVQLRRIRRPVTS